MDIVTLSGIRKELLLYLDESPHNLSEIRDRFDITSPEVSPRIKELMEHKLVKLEDKKYHLTSLGKTIVLNFRPFADTIDLFNQYPDFWGEHDLSSIPDELLKRIGEIKNYMVIEDDIDDIDRTMVEMLDIIKKSKYIYGVSCVFDDGLLDVYRDISKNGGHTSIVVKENIYSLIEKNYGNLAKEFIENGDSIYLSRNDIRTSFIVTDNWLYLALYFNNGKFDLHSNVISSDPAAIKWGIDLFEYYKSTSETCK
jgi:predicted transcriptional regulator